MLVPTLEEHSVRSREARKINFVSASKKCNRSNNKSSLKYTSAELPVRNELKKLGYIEGLTFFHNYPLATVSPKGNNTHFWLDFVIPEPRWVIECSPRMWHKLDKRIESDIRKRKEIEAHGFIYIELSELEIERLKDERLIDIIVEVLCRDGQNCRGTEE